MEDNQQYYYRERRVSKQTAQEITVALNKLRNAVIVLFLLGGGIFASRIIPSIVDLGGTGANILLCVFAALLLALLITAVFCVKRTLAFIKLSKSIQYLD